MIRKEMLKNQESAVGRRKITAGKQTFIMALEPRIMFDAAAVATLDAVAETEPAADAGAKTTVESIAGNQVAFVDSSLRDSKALLDGLGKAVQVVALEQGRDALGQISDYLASHSDITALHLFSHGTPGSVNLGDTALTADTLASHASQLASWQQSLTADADILLYGCDIGAGQQGEALLLQLATLTGADVAASVDATGAADKGGNWVLERTTGPIEAVALSVAGYDGLMAAPVNTVPTARTVAEDNTITFSGGTLISVADADGGNLTTAISVNNGTLTLSQTTGLTFNSGTNGTAGMSITGSVADINSALNGLVYRPTKDYSGADTLTIATTDGSTTDTDTVGITVTPNATAPVLTLPATTQNVTEDIATYLDFTGSNAIILTDADANDLLTLTLSVEHGTLQIKTDVSQGVTSATGNGTGTVVLSGTAAQLSATLAHAQGVQYTSALNYNSSHKTLGAEALSFSLSDGVAEHSESGSVAINVTQVNDAPVINGVALTMQEGDSNIAFGLTNVAPSADDLDPDIASGQQVLAQQMIQITSMPQHGSISYQGGVVEVGSVIPVSSLANLKYTHTGGDIAANQTDQIGITVNDGGGSTTAGFLNITITPKNVAPTVSGSPSLYEGQVKVVAPSIALGDSFDTLSNSVIVIDTIVTGGQGTFFIDANGNNVVDAGEEITEATTLNADQRANFATQFKFFQNGYEPNTPGAISPSYHITVTDAGGGEGIGAARQTAATIQLTVNPNNDDPTLTNAHYDSGHALEVNERTITVLTNTMLLASDADLNPANPSELWPARNLVYTVESAPLRGELQLDIGSGNWVILGVGGRFTQDDINNSRVRYRQTTDVDVTTIDNFTFTLRDSSYGYDFSANPGATNPSIRAGALRDNPTDTDPAVRTFAISIAPFVEDGGSGPGGPTPGYGTVTYDFSPVGGMPSSNIVTGVTWYEDNLSSTDSGVLSSAMLNYKITRTAGGTTVEVPAAETVYTLSSLPGNGTLQRDIGGGTWQTLAINAQFTQQDINDSKIRFVHDGSENHTSSFGYKVSDGTDNTYDDSFELSVVPINDRPTASGGSATVREKATDIPVPTDGIVRLTSDVVGMSDVDLSQDVSKRTGEGAQDFLWFKITDLPTHGTLERWDGSAWIAVDTSTWLPQSLLSATANGATSGLRYIHDGTEPLAYIGGPKDTFIYVVRDDLAAPGSAWATDATAPTLTDGSGQSNQSAVATATINIIPVNNAPHVADKPGDVDPVITGTITSGGATTGVNEVLSNVPEGGTATITSAYLVAVDQDNTTVQRQFRITSVPTQGLLQLNNKTLGVGSTFTQDDIDNNRLTYKHNGSEVGAQTTDALGSYHDKFHFVVSDAVYEDAGADANKNVFLITLTPSNDKPTVTVPSGTIEIDSADAANNRITGVTVADPDLTDGVITGESDFIQVTVRLLDNSSNPITNYANGFAGGGVSIGYTPQAGGLWAVTRDGNNNILQIQGTRQQVNDALAGLSVTFANDTNTLYKLEIIADDRMRASNGALDTTSSDANGGEMNQATTAGGNPTAVPGTVYDWSADVAVPANDPNITAATVNLRASRVNEATTFTGPAAETVNEDVRTRIPNTFDIADPESAAFNTPVTVTLSVPNGHGTLGIGAVGAATSLTPSGGQAVTISGDNSRIITMTGRAADIKALLNGKNYTNNADDPNGGLYYTSPTNGNHDYNGDDTSDVTLTLSLADTGSRFGSDVGAGSVANNPADIVIPITITPVNDAPTVAAGSGTVSIAGLTPVTGFVISDVDNTDGETLAVSTTGETDFMQATIRLLPETGTTPLPASGDAGGIDHTNVVFSSSSAGGATVDATYNGTNKALVIRGTLEQVNTYLSGLQVTLSGNFLNNNTLYRVQVIADDRLRNGDGVLTASANGGSLNFDSSTDTAAVPATEIDPHLALPSLYNVASATRQILGSDVNEPPSFALLDNTPTFAENGSAVVLDADATLSDPELSTHNNWDHAVLTLERNTGANSDDIFGVTGSGSTGINFNGSNIRNGSTVVGTFTNAGGTLTITFNSSATNTVVNSVLQAITYSNSNNNPPGSVTINYTINDGDTDADRASNGQGSGGALTGSGSITVGITPTNDNPTLTGLTAKSYTEDATAIVIGTNATPGDPELAIFAGNAGNWGNATLTISRNGGANAEDTFSASGTLSPLTAGSTLTDNGTTIGTITTNSSGTLKLTFAEDATTAQVQAAIRQIAYSNSRQSLAAGATATVTLNWLLEDGDTDEDRATNPQGTGGNKTVTGAQTITLTGVNDAPVLADTALSISQVEDAAVPSGAVGTFVSALASGSNITDADTANPKGIAITATDSTRGTWYYSINGGTNWTAFTASETTARLLAADPNTRIYFKPNADWHGSVASGLTIRAWDGSTGSNGGTAAQDLSNGSNVGGTTAFSSATDTVDLTVTPVNDAPTLGGSATLTATDEDTTSSSATAATIAAALTYGDGTDNQTASSGGTTETAQTALAIVGNGATAGEGTWQYTTDDSTWINVATGISNTTAVVLDLANAAHKIRFVPATNYNGTPGALTLRAADGAWNSATGVQNISTAVGGTGTWSSSTATLAITVNAVNDPPVATDDTATITENTASVTGNVKTGVNGTLDTDIDNSNAELSVVSFRTGNTEGAGTAGTVGGTALAGLYGTLQLNADGSYTYTLDMDNVAVNGLKTGQSLHEYFNYSIKDPSNATDSAVLDITINGVTDGAPTITPDDHNGGATGQTEVYEKGLAAPSDGSQISTGTIAVTAADGMASVTLGGTTFTVAELAGFSVGSPSADIDTGEGTLKVTGFTVTSGNASAPTAGTLSYSYTLKARHEHTGGTAGESTDSIALVITDATTAADTANGTLTVRIIDDTPTANADVNSVDKDATAAITGNVVTNDRIGADTTATPVTAISFGGNAKTVGTAFDSTYGTLTLNSNGAYSYTLDNSKPAVTNLRSDETLTEVINYTITDADGDTSSTTLTITINGINHNPVAVADTGSAIEAGGLNNGTAGTPATGNVLTNDTDVDSGDTKTVTTTGVTIGTYGTLTLNADGNYSYIVDDNNPVVQALRISGETVSETFNYTMKDTDGLASSSTLTITIHGANDTPVAQPETATTLEDTPVSGNVLINDTDIDNGTTLTVTQFSIEGSQTIYTAAQTALIQGVGSIVIAANGNYTFTPAHDYSGPVPTVTYTVSDGELTTTSRLDITVEPITDTPSLVVQSVVTDQDSEVLLLIQPDVGDTLLNDAGAERITAVAIADIPAGASLTLADGTPVAITGGVATVPGDRISGLHFMPPPGFGGEITLTVTAIAQDGTAASISVSRQLQVTVNALPPVLQPVPQVTSYQAVDTPTAAETTTTTITQPGFGHSDPGAPAFEQILQLTAADIVMSSDSSPMASSSGIVAYDNTSGTSEYNLYIAKTPSSQEVLVEQEATFSLPTGTFRHSSSNAKVGLEATLADGRPLPGWLSFDSESGRFTGKPPADSGGAMDIKIMAKDDRGNVAFTQFLLHISDKKSSEAQLLKGQGAEKSADQVVPENAQPAQKDGADTTEAEPGNPERPADGDSAKDKSQQQSRKGEPAMGRLSLSEQFKRQQQRSRNADLVTALQKVSARRG